LKVLKIAGKGLSEMVNNKTNVVRKRLNCKQKLWP